jgi:NAD+--asparagine ADP-ribosyltransferase
LKSLSSEVVEELRENPALAKDLMTPGSYRHLVNKTELYNASFGKAVERRLAQKIAEDPKLAKSIRHTGLARGPNGQFISSPDFTRGKKGKTWDTTTNAGVPAHEKRYGDKPVSYLTYDVLGGVDFPK